MPWPLSNGACSRPARRLACEVMIMPAVHAARARANLPQEPPHAIATMLAYAEGTAEWEEVLLRMAVFLTSAVRSKKVPALAQTLAAGTAAGTLAERLG